MFFSLAPLSAALPLLPLLTLGAYPKFGSSGCGKPLPSTVVPGANSTAGTVTSGGRERDYRIHIPKTYQKHIPVPVILSYHGRTEDAEDQEQLSQFSNPTYNPTAIAVYPQGVKNPNGIRQWLGDPEAPTSINDIQFTSDLINSLSSTYCIDPKRIYATGKSNGGGLCGLLACDPDTSSKIAAFAPVSGAYYFGVLGADQGRRPDCRPSRKRIPFLEFHGYEDKTIKYNGGETGSKRGNTTGIPEYMNLWAKRNDIDPRANVTETLCIRDGYPPVLEHTWGDGLVRHHNISNLEHDWPSQGANSDNDGTRTTCFEATSKIMDFFHQFTLD